jgi:hypothetical protein
MNPSKTTNGGPASAAAQTLCESTYATGAIVTVANTATSSTAIRVRICSPTEPRRRRGERGEVLRPEGSASAENRGRL